MVNNSSTPHIPPAETTDFLPSPSIWTRLGSMLILSALGTAMILASVTKYKVVVRATANIRPEGELRLVQAENSGSIVQILVEENQKVEPGDLIAILDDSRLQNQKDQLEINTQQAQLQLLSIKTQLSVIESKIASETEAVNRSINQAQAELKGYRRDYQDQRTVNYSELQEARANLNSAQQELEKAYLELDSAKADLKATEAAWQVARSKYHRYQPVAELGALSQDLLESVQLEAEQQKQALEAQKITVEVTKRNIKQLESNLEAASARLDRFEATLNPSPTEIEVSTENLAQVKARGEVILATLNKEKEELIQQQLEITKQIAQNEQELQQLANDLKQTKIKATASGTITQLTLRNPGQIVQNGENIASIIPNHAPLVIKALVSTEEISRLKLGQKVQMRVSACPHPDYGLLNGVVSQIGKDTTKLESTQESFYEVTIQPEHLYLGKGNNQCYLQLGMEGRADIITQEETVIKFVLRKTRLIADF